MSYIIDSNDANFGFRLRKFQLYNHTMAYTLHNILVLPEFFEMKFKFINGITTQHG